MSSPGTSGESSPRPLRIPAWLRVKLPSDPAFAATCALVREKGLHTVCSSARCPNIWECYQRRTATFLILGNTCTRNCAFCNIEPAALPLAAPDADEPRRVAEASAELGLKHVVVTSVTRDDLPDGGAAHFAATVRAVRAALPTATVEVLIPDFQGDERALGVVLEAAPDVINHNVETVPDLYPAIRPQAGYARSLELLARVRAAGAVAKSGLMVGLGETDSQTMDVVRDLARTGCSIVTVGQYMRPSLKHPPVARYVPPPFFDEYAACGRTHGIPYVFSAPLVRSSYMAGAVLERLKDGQAPSGAGPEGGAGA
ncbi:MAG: lipoyl synthase [Desulfovibrionaceae bacterium]|jgi:lipoic acid synthetase|nr:lipoyl synthase [Desulfovibrionaceae bacterium]